MDVPLVADGGRKRPLPQTPYIEAARPHESVKAAYVATLFE